MATITIQGTLFDGAGNPVEPTKATLKATRRALDGGVVLAVPTPVEVSGSQLTITAPEGLADLTVHVGDEVLTFPIMIADGYTLGQAVDEAASAEGVRPHDLFRLLQEVQGVRADVERMASTVGDTAREAGETAKTQFDEHCQQQLEQLGEILRSVEQARDATTSTVDAVTEQVEEAARAVTQHKIIAEGAKNNLDVMAAYLESAQEAERKAQQASDTAVEVAAQTGAGIDGAVQRLSALEKQVGGIDSKVEDAFVRLIALEIAGEGDE
ncbi:hypothetical protein [Corynebacterium aquilae]|uniref:Methyl-accepting transducer domain-containing protein n=1 Tax=Corynebacterium aquilae DSM 44791 TaxID=1431546 RepID=A0A1L7CFA6_9CORY|nr:hypothetical protein [Corynebacterium aquilae]APT84515.1 hypothetical protein CAQU_04975 [Corynebacterium aquilae DSM 44791]